MAHSINQDCFACGDCLRACDAGAISPGDIYEIDPQLCIDCGRCKMYCIAEAIEGGEDEESGYSSDFFSEEDESKSPLNIIDLLSEALPKYLEDEMHVNLRGTQNKTQGVYRDSSDKEIVEETIDAINNQIAGNLNPRKFLWGNRDEIDRIGRYVVANCEMDFNRLCEEIASQGLRFDKRAFDEELGSFKSKSLMELYHRRQVEKYVYVDRLCKDEILNLIESSKKQMEDKKYKMSSAYYDKMSFIKEMKTDEILELIDELTDELLNR